MSSSGIATAGPLTNSATAVSDELFTVTLDLGNQFPGANRWLERAVRTSGNGSFITLVPQQSLTSIPYAIQARRQPQPPPQEAGLSPGDYRRQR